MSDQPAVKESPIASKFKTQGQHYGSPLSSVHGPAPLKEAGPAYECADCRDLYERMRKVFKEMGHEL